MTARTARAAKTQRRFFSQLLQREVEPPSEATCVGCGCTDSQGCREGCWWLEVNRQDGTGVCSCCPEQLKSWRRLQ